MMRFPCLSYALFALATSAVLAEAQESRRTVLDGVYTEAQAERGMASYDSKCASCHKPTLDGGPEALPLRGEHFQETWRDDSLEPLFDHMRTRMPRRPAGEPGSLNAETYVDIITYILKVNEYPPGSTELTQDTLANILLVGMEGPRPLPTNASVQAVGCFMPGTGGSWKLTNAGDLSRSRNTEEITSDELKAAAAKLLGAQEFKLSNLDDFKAGFQPEAFKGKKVLVKGPLTRSASGDRIFVLSLDAAAPSCAP
jgi:S-disulfanyl-L-cysteine oxidoreductase SoxD